MCSQEERCVGWLVGGTLSWSAGVATESRPLVFGGVFAIAMFFRCRKKALGLEYLFLYVLACGSFELLLASNGLAAAIPLILSYVVGYVLQQREARVALRQKAGGGACAVSIIEPRPTAAGACEDRSGSDT